MSILAQKTTLRCFYYAGTAWKWILIEEVSLRIAALSDKIIISLNLKVKYTFPML